MENNFNIGDIFYRVWISNYRVEGEVYTIKQITNLYYFVVDRKNISHKFRKDNTSLIKDRDLAITKYYQFKQKIDFKINIGDSFSALLNGERVTYKILPIAKQVIPTWTGAASYGKRYKYLENNLYHSQPNEGSISELSPLAQAVLGKKIGDSYSYMIDTKKFYGVILDIEK